MRQRENPEIAYFLYFSMEKLVIHYGMLMLDRVFQGDNTPDIYLVLSRP